MGERSEGGRARTDGGAVSDERSVRGATGGPLDRLSGAVDRRFGSDFLESSPFWLPPFLLMALFVYGAIIWNLMISLTDYQGFAGAPDYSNLDFEMYAKA